jgi:hypothetical protein
MKTIMNETFKTKSGWRIPRRVLIALAILATLIAIFYTEEDWRGKRAWENCKRELEAKGAVLDWDKFIPPPVPDEQNFFEAPKMAEWFVRKRQASTNELTARLNNKDTTVTITSETAAAQYLAWSDQFEPDFDLIREALKRPYTRMDGDYSQPLEMPIPSFGAMRSLGQVLAQRAKCCLLLGQPEKALRELTLVNDSRRITEREPTGQPMTLVGAMVNVAIAGLYVNAIADGLQKNAWREPQLVALQKQLAEINLSPFVAEAFQEGSVGDTRAFETTPLAKIFPSARWPVKVGYWLMPRGWVYQNLAPIAKLWQQQASWFDLTNNVILPGKVASVRQEFETATNHFSPYTFLATIAMPNTTKASQTLAHNQTLVYEAQIACALERCRLAYGNYPPTLDALVPQFIEKLPHDIIGGQPLHYRRTDNGQFLLYSIGWNETDDGGIASDKMDQGDWVWQYPLK